MSMFLPYGELQEIYKKLSSHAEAYMAQARVEDPIKAHSYLERAQNMMNVCFNLQRELSNLQIKERR